MQRDTLEEASAATVLDDRVVVEPHLNFLLTAAHLIDDTAVELFGKVDDQFVNHPFVQRTDDQHRAVFIWRKFINLQQNSYQIFTKTHSQAARRVDS